MGYSPPDYSDTLEQIIHGFPNDAAILAQAACCLHAAGRWVRALEVLDDAIKLRPDSPELLWQRASYRRQVNMTQGAVEDLLSLLDLHDPQKLDTASASEEDWLESISPLDGWGGADWRFDLPEELREGELVASEISDYSDRLRSLPGIDDYVASAVWQLRQLSPNEGFEEAKRKPAVAMLPPQAKAILLAERPPERPKGRPQSLIRERKWRDVADLLGPRLEYSDWSREDAVCLFMAWWGLENEEELRKCANKIRDQFETRWAAKFESLLQTCASKIKAHLKARGRASYEFFDRANPISEFQFMALACWKAGAGETANRILDRIEEAVLRAELPESAPVFSYWWLRRVSWEVFREDIASIRKLFMGAVPSPPFLGKQPTHR
jgi:hypothetical protein